MEKRTHSKATRLPPEAKATEPGLRSEATVQIPTFTVGSGRICSMMEPWLKGQLLTIEPLTRAPWEGCSAFFS